MRRRKKILAELDQDIQDHIQRETQDNMDRGMSPEDARTAALRNFGNITRIKEDTRAIWTVVWLEQFIQDMRFGLRSLRKSPGFTIAAVLTLALGIGANTAIFSIVSWLVLRPLPVERPDQLTFLAFPQGGSQFDNMFSLEDYRQIRAASGPVFSDVGVFSFGGSMGGFRGSDGLTADGTTKPVQTVFVSGNFFSMLGIRPHLGRFLLSSEGTVPGADPVVVISYAYWRSRFARNPSIIGKQVKINGHVLTVIGIAPRDFYGVTPIVDMQAYLPLSMSAIEGSAGSDWFTDPKARPLIVFGRLRNHATLAQAEAALAAVGQQLAKQNARQQASPTLLVLPLRPPGLLNGPNPLPTLATLFLTLSGLVLMLATINVANLLLVRAGVRQHEMSIRAALGAARGRLTRQMLTESMMLALFGCASGILVGVICNRLLTHIPLQTEFPVVFDVNFDWRVFLYTVAASALAGTLVGLVPAFRASRCPLAEMIQERGRSTTPSRQRGRTALAVAQLGGSLALLIAAALLTRSLAAVKGQDFGFDPRNVLNLKVSPRQIGMSEAQGTEFYRELLERVRVLPGVQSASLASSVPLGDDSAELPIEVSGFELPKNGKTPTAVHNIVSPEYFPTMRMRLVNGRDFSQADAKNTTKVAIINQEMADHFWPRQNPIGRQFAVPGDPNDIFQVIGIVNNSRTLDVDGPIAMAFYVTAGQNYMSSGTLQVRTSQAPENVAPTVLGLVHSIQPTMPVYGIRTMEQALNGINGLQLYSIGAELAATMGALGLLLAIIGVYGVVAYSVNQRRHEIGIRMALGGQPSAILYAISKQGLGMVCGGIAFGLSLAFALSRLLSGFVTGVSTLDPLTYVAVTACLAVVAMLAAYIPTRRATRVNPMAALRCE